MKLFYIVYVEASASFQAAAPHLLTPGITKSGVKNLSRQPTEGKTGFKMHSEEAVRLFFELNPRRLHKLAIKQSFMTAR